MNLFKALIVTYHNHDITTKEEIVCLTEDLHTLIDRKAQVWDPTNEKLFILPGCKVPRIRLKDKNLKTTQVLDKADAVVSPIKSSSLKPLLNGVYTQMQSFMYGVTATKSNKDLFEFLKEGYLKYNENVFSKKPLEVQQKVIDQFDVLIQKNDLQVDIILFDYQLAHFFNLAKPAEEKQESRRLYTIIEDTAHSLFTNPNLNIISERDVIKHIVGDLVIDYEKYNNLRQMFDSNQKDDIFLAASILVNSNYIENSYYIVALLTEFYVSIVHHKAHTNIGFKSMLAYYGYQGMSRFNKMTAVDFIKLINKEDKE